MPLEDEAKMVLNQQNNDVIESEEEIAKSEEKSVVTRDGNDEDNTNVEVATDNSCAVVAEEDKTKGDDETDFDLENTLNQVLDQQKKLSDMQLQIESKVIQTLKENASFQVQVRQNMQKELEESKKKLSGDIFIPLLKEIAELYSDWKDVLNDMEDGVAKRKVNGVFEILQELLEEYGCEFGHSDVGSKRKPKYSKLKEKIFTSCKEKHETVAKSHNSWIVKEPFVLYPEYVSVYVYDETQLPANADVQDYETRTNDNDKNSQED